MKIFYPTPLFNGLQVGRFDPFYLKMIGLDGATITNSLQCRITRSRAVLIRLEALPGDLEKPLIMVELRRVISQRLRQI